MAIQNHAQRAAAAVAIFGKSAAASMGFLKAGADGAIAEMQRLRTLFGVDITQVQRQAINQMNDALGRLTLPLSGFINQLTAGIAPAITTAARLMLQFLGENAKGWNLSTTLAKAFTAALRYVSAAVTTIYAGFQVLWATLARGEAMLKQHLVAPMFRFLADWSQGMGEFVKQLEHGIRKMISSITFLHQELMRLMAAGLEKIGQSGLANQLRKAADDMANLGQGDSGAGDAIKGSENWARGMAQVAELNAAKLFQEAAKAQEKGMDLIQNPFRPWDDMMARVLADAKKAADELENGMKAGGVAVKKAVEASSKELRAIVVGTTEGESFRNMLARGGDARLGSDPAKDTAENTERAADGIEELVAFQEAAAFGLAAINV